MIKVEKEADKMAVFFFFIKCAWFSDKLKSQIEFVSIGICGNLEIESTMYSNNNNNFVTTMIKDILKLFKLGC